MWLALLRNTTPGLHESRTRRGCRKPARHKLDVELLEDRQLLAGGFIHWAEGIVSPGDSFLPAAPTMGDVIRFTLHGPKASNACVAEVSFGRPELEINLETQVIEVGFHLPPQGTECPDVYEPVTGFAGELTGLPAGGWLLFGPLSGFAFTIQAPEPAEPVPLEFEKVQLGPISRYRFTDPTFTGEDLVIQDQEAWQAFWAAHTSGISPPPAPEIDFENRIVLVTLLGRQSSGGGPRTDIEAVSLSPDGVLTVLVRDNRLPGPLTVITSPFHIVSIPRVAFAAPVFVHQEVQPFETIDQTPISYLRYDDPEFTGLDLIIQDQDTWRAFWEQHSSGLIPPPEIDFESEMVIVTLMGFRPTGGYSTTIQDVLFNPVDGTLTVRIRDVSPEPDAIVPDVITNPFHIVVVPRVAYTSVVFEHVPA